ncbi:DUF4272 domain-containing protein [Paenibacillus nasutitermitis]|uniref:DUF4272 domain-containing protein n=1 Tax=Paenibacillus nasutitermitis TaxID=1652958 RepID=A0A916ZCW5_9BACL|nr:DUF4272 domain-containing protein [Paenibacillus nasutitermitis]GGD89390.1 hypothetical protein GCM10010911_55000 [Paenibacillus nasutitermitis]
MKNCAIYSTSINVDQIMDRLRRLYPKASIKSNGDGTEINVIHKKWLSKTVNTFTVMTSGTDPETFVEMIDGMGHFFSRVPARNTDIQEKLLLQISTFNMVIGVQTEKDIAEPFYSELLQLTGQLNGLILMGGKRLLNDKGELVMDADGVSRVEDLVVTAHTSYLHKDLRETVPALLRKERSEALLTERGIPFNKTLPVLAAEEAVAIRSREEIAGRAIALCIAALKGECCATDYKPEETKALIGQVMQQYGAEPLLSPRESAFIANDHPDDAQAIQFAWCYEGYWVLLWALGYVERLDAPVQVCDVEAAVSILHRYDTYEAFLADARVRTKSEILDEADLIYRYHWACVDARLHNQPVPGGLESGVVFERHRALNWLTTSMNQEWDEVATHT